MKQEDKIQYGISDAQKIRKEGYRDPTACPPRYFNSFTVQMACHVPDQPTITFRGDLSQM